MTTVLKHVSFLQSHRVNGTKEELRHRDHNSSNTAVRPGAVIDIVTGSGSYTSPGKVAPAVNGRGAGHNDKRAKRIKPAVRTKINTFFNYR